MYWVYWGVVIMLLMSYCAAGYVAYVTVTNAVSTSRGFYATYGKWSDFGSLMGFYELLVVFLYLLWSLFTVILSSIAGGQLWLLMDERYAESTQCVFCGELALSFDKGMRHFDLSMIAGFAALITAASFGDTADKVIAFFDLYDAKTRREACDTDSSSSCEFQNDPAGTSATYDILFHLISVFYGYFVLSVISLGGYIFMLVEMGFEDGYDCDFVPGIDQAYYFPII